MCSFIDCRQVFLLKIFVLCVVSGILGTRCPPKWKAFNGKCYFVVKTKLNWPNAKSSCENATTGGSHLAHIISQAENDFISGILGNRDAWIAANFIETEEMSEFNSRFPLTWSNWDDNPDSSEHTRSGEHSGRSDSDDSSENESSKHKKRKKHNGRSDSVESSETSSRDMESGENNGTWTESSEGNSTHWESSERNSSEMERAGRNGSEEYDERDGVHNVSVGGNSSAEDTGGWRLPGNTTQTWCVSVRDTLWRIDECVHDTFSHVCELSNVPNATDGWAFDNSERVRRTRHYVRHPDAVISGAAVLTEKATVTSVGCAAQCAAHGNCSVFCHRRDTATCRLHAQLSAVQAAQGWTTYTTLDTVGDTSEEDETVPFGLD